MAASPPGVVTELLRAWGDGDDRALQQLTPLVEGELRRLARAYMARERRDHTLQATALVNEAFIRMTGARDVDWQDRAHFIGVSARLMRRVLVDHARRRDRVKRGGDAMQVSLSEAAHVPTPERADVLALDQVLQQLEQLDPRKSRIVEMRFFGGLSLEEAAEALNVSVATVRRDWSLARAWLFRELKSSDH